MTWTLIPPALRVPSFVLEFHVHYPLPHYLSVGRAKRTSFSSCPCIEMLPLTCSMAAASIQPVGWVVYLLPLLQVVVPPVDLYLL